MQLAITMVLNMAIEQLWQKVTLACKAKVKNVWNYTFTMPHIFMACKETTLFLP